MNKIFTLSLIILFLSLTSTVFAQSSASVEINNKINSFNTSTSNIESKTNVRIETNGKITEYSTDEPNQKIEVKAVDGESSIKVDGEEVSKAPTENNTTISPKPTVISEDQSIEEISTKNQIVEFVKEKFNFIEKIFSFLDSLGK